MHRLHEQMRRGAVRTPPIRSARTFAGPQRLDAPGTPWAIPMPGHVTAAVTVDGIATGILIGGNLDAIRTGAGAGSTLQKWNAPPNILQSLPLKDIAERSRPPRNRNGFSRELVV